MSVGKSQAKSTALEFARSMARRVFVSQPVPFLNTTKIPLPNATKNPKINVTVGWHGEVSSGSQSLSLAYPQNVRLGAGAQHYRLLWRAETTSENWAGMFMCIRSPPFRHSLISHLINRISGSIVFSAG
ncbi:hypothetical protein HI914_06435 [Erysiphe necator]|nr:hypothetical protein HI914_06435 [Erysiphe necator]